MSYAITHLDGIGGQVSDVGLGFRQLNRSRNRRTFDEQSPFSHLIEKEGLDAALVPCELVTICQRALGWVKNRTYYERVTGRW